MFLFKLLKLYHPVKASHHFYIRDQFSLNFVTKSVDRMRLREGREVKKVRRSSRGRLEGLREEWRSPSTYRHRVYVNCFLCLP